MKKHIERKKENHTSLTHFSLFSGIGGLDLAAEMAGFKTLGQCELDDYAIKILEKHWPNVPKWRDIRNVTGLQVARKISEEITVLSGGFPCQPHSVAGKRLASSDERDLWGEFARIIREIKPKWIVAENVPGLLSSEHGRFFGRVLRAGECFRHSKPEWSTNAKEFVLLPTPTATDGMAWTTVGKNCLKTMRHIFSKKGNPSKHLFYLNMLCGNSAATTANFYEMIMGFPTRWTDLSV